jgi:hypothetical protein
VDEGTPEEEEDESGLLVIVESDDEGKARFRGKTRSRVIPPPAVKTPTLCI